jgi:hypothetical protein
MKLRNPSPHAIPPDLNTVYWMQADASRNILLALREEPKDFFDDAPQTLLVMSPGGDLLSSSTFTHLDLYDQLPSPHYFPSQGKLALDSGSRDVLFDVESGQPQDLRSCCSGYFSGSDPSRGVLFLGDGLNLVGVKVSNGRKLFRRYSRDGFTEPVVDKTGAVHFLQGSSHHRVVSLAPPSYRPSKWPIASQMFDYAKILGVDPERGQVFVRHYVSNLIELTVEREGQHGRRLSPDIEYPELVLFDESAYFYVLGWIGQAAVCRVYDAATVRRVKTMRFAFPPVLLGRDSDGTILSFRNHTLERRSARELQLLQSVDLGAGLHYRDDGDWPDIRRLYPVSVDTASRIAYLATDTNPGSIAEPDVSLVRVDIDTFQVLP